MPRKTVRPNVKDRPTHRKLQERWVITGLLILETPAHFGGGDFEALTDMALLRDELDQSPLLPGASLAGALRNYLRERWGGYNRSAPRPWVDSEKDLAQEESKSPPVLLFGGLRGDDDGIQSPLIVCDAHGKAAGEELRDGVAIDPGTRTAVPRKKYDVQLLPAGSSFELRFELLISERIERSKLLAALAIALDGLAKGEIKLGMRKRRGFGRVRVTGWSATRFDLKTRPGLLAWLSEDHPDWYSPRPAVSHSNSIYTALGIRPDQDEKDARRYCDLHAEFALHTSLLVRSGFGEADTGPDVVHLHSPRPGADGSQHMRPVLPGSSLAGALRARAMRISRTLAKEEIKADLIVEEMFGPADISTDTDPWASRLEVWETEIKQAYPLVQSRVKIDRFTGGAADTALFEEEALFANPETHIEVHLRLRNPNDAEVGLLLLLLKDLWTGDLPLGGGASIGRGRLRGKKAELIVAGIPPWSFEQPEEDARLKVSGDPKLLQGYVDALHEELKQ